MILLYPIGTKVLVCGEIRGTITAIGIRGLTNNLISYEVTYPNGQEIECLWSEAYLVDFINETDDSDWEPKYIKLA